MCGYQVFKNIWYRVEKSSNSEWCGARGNDLFIAQDITRRYVAWWVWEGSYTSFYENEIWLYKYNIESRECIWKKNIGPTSRYWIYHSCFITGDNKVYLSRRGKKNVETVVCDLESLKQIQILNYRAEPTRVFGSHAYREIAISPYVSNCCFPYVWGGNEKDALIRDEDVQYMKEHDTNRIGAEKYGWQVMCPNHDINSSTHAHPTKIEDGGKYFQNVYNNLHEPRRIIWTPICNPRTHSYSLIDEKTGQEIDHVTDAALCNFYYNDTLYNTSVSNDGKYFCFFRRNCLTHTNENLILELPPKNGQQAKPPLN
jgi:hypothetical protein